jgi:hypothetical protein
VGWLKRKNRRPPREPATFAQTVVIVREVLTVLKAGVSDIELTEAVIDLHLARDFQYDKAQIHKAIDALTRNRTN